MRWSIVWALMLVAWCACASRSTATFALALGWKGALPTWQGTCREDGRGTSVRLDRGTHRAVAVGVTMFDCAEGVLRLEVRAPTRLVVDGGPLEVGTKSDLRVVASDDRGELALGDSAEVEWVLPPELAEAERCNHMLGTCADPFEMPVVGRARGAFPVTVSFGGQSSTTTIVVR